MEEVFSSISCRRRVREDSDRTQEPGEDGSRLSQLCPWCRKWELPVFLIGVILEEYLCHLEPMSCQICRVDERVTSFETRSLNLQDRQMSDVLEHRVHRDLKSHIAYFSLFAA